MTYYSFICPKWRPQVPSIAEQIAYSRWASIPIPQTCTWHDQNNEPWNPEIRWDNGISKQLKARFTCDSHNVHPYVYQRHAAHKLRETSIIEQYYERVAAVDPLYLNAEYHIELLNNRREKYILFPEALRTGIYFSRYVWLPKRPPSPTLHTGW